MKLHVTAGLVVVSLAILRNASGQDFVNLDFEDATLVPDPSSSAYAYGAVYASDAIPGWTGYLGTTPVTDVLYDDFTLGNASIDIIDQKYQSSLIEGQYTLVLQAGVLPIPNSSGFQNADASISQTGFVPTDARSLQLKAFAPLSFSVSLGGQNLSLIPLASGQNYTLYGADISLFAGQLETLTIAALGAPNSGPQYFDSIVFSPSSVPEPAVFSLFALGGLFLGLRRSN